ncbi:MAG: hypothetical protein ACRDIE_07735, partial [Chloroflexota bacterium]
MTVPAVANAPRAITSGEEEERRLGPPDRSWTMEHLRHALDELCVRYGHPVMVDLGGPATEEPESAAPSEFAAPSYLAAAVACALRVSSAYPPLAFGPWSGTPLLAHLGVVIPPVRAERDLFSEPEPYADLSAHRPIFLVPELADQELLTVLFADPLLVNPRLEATADDCRVVQAGIRRPKRPAGLPISDAGNPGERQIEYAVEVRASRLLGAVRHGLILYERETGVPPVLGEACEAGGEPTAAPTAEWLALVPELPAWARSVAAFGPTPAETYARWLNLIPMAPTAGAGRALRTRAYLTHHLVALTLYSPAMGWAALLSVAEDAGKTLVAADAAGVRVLPPSVQGAELEWVSDHQAGTPCVRPPLRVLSGIGSLADQIVLSRRLDGPFESVGDLVRRVPALAANPDLFRCLLEAGALDQVGDASRMQAHWSAIAAWCASAISNPEAAEPVADGTPVFGVPAEPDHPLGDVHGWWGRFGRAAEQVGSQADQSCLSIEGTPGLAKATIRGSRSWRADGAELTVIALEDDARSRRIVLAGPETGEGAPRPVSVLSAPPTRDGGTPIWVESRLVAAPRPQVEIIVPLVGDRDRDLDRLSRLQATLREHKGDSPVH